ncbi:MAG: hypothetical protein U5R14_08035 [Gemmatimonadota bacterium]|nr:hypothetical protein [Gemmatimonadota bacterium]
MEDIDPEYLQDHPRYESHRATAAEFATRPGATDLVDEAFLDDAVRRGDWCHYMTDEDTVVTYGWYSSAAVPVGPDATIEHSGAYAYMYNGFTPPEFRGQHLHGYCMGQGLKEAIQRGYSGLISYVEAQNAPSIKSVRRLGYRPFGTAVRLNPFGRAFTLNSRGCRNYDFRLTIVQS